MDRIINNESVAICAILNSLVLGIDDIARLNLFVVMTTDRAIRNRLVNYTNYEEMVGKESSYSACVFECYNDAFDGWKD